MKRKIISLYVLLLAAFGYAAAQETITVTANHHEISDNLDLQAVASIFGDSENLEDFENRLNDPNTQISNLDLNRDGYVDYLRVVELSENYTHLIAIQAVIGNDLYQDVATIEVERSRHGATTIQVVGNSYIYGPDYIIEPVYVYRPLIVVWFWGPYYRPWISPYYYGYYPYYFRPWHPYHPRIYRTHVHVHVNVYNTYHYTNIRKCGMATNMHHRVARNDYGSRYPEHSFTNRNHGIANRSGLNQHRSSTAASTAGSRPARQGHTNEGYHKTSKQSKTARNNDKFVGRKSESTAQKASRTYSEKNTTSKQRSVVPQKTEQSKIRSETGKVSNAKNSSAVNRVNYSHKQNSTTKTPSKTNASISKPAKQNSKTTIKKGQTNEVASGNKTGKTQRSASRYEGR